MLFVSKYIYNNIYNWQVDDANVVAAIRDLPCLTALRTLILKAFTLNCLQPLLSSQVGLRLRRLDLHYNYHQPGVNLAEIGNACPFLAELSVCDALVTYTTNRGGVRNTRPTFTRLVALKLLRVTYINNDDWEAIPRLAKNIRILHLESSRAMSDAAFQSLLIDNPLHFLEVLFSAQL